jgi:hypothetical protein
MKLSEWEIELKPWSCSERGHMSSEEVSEGIGGEEVSDRGCRRRAEREEVVWSFHYCEDCVR